MKIPTNEISGEILEFAYRKSRAALVNCLQENLNKTRAEIALWNPEKPLMAMKFASEMSDLIDEACRSLGSLRVNDLDHPDRPKKIRYSATYEEGTWCTTGANPEEAKKRAVVLSVYGRVMRFDTGWVLPGGDTVALREQIR